MKAIRDELATPASDPSDRANLQRDFDEYALAMGTACPGAH